MEAPCTFMCWATIGDRLQLTSQGKQNWRKPMFMEVFMVGETDTRKSTYAIQVACRTWSKSHDESAWSPMCGFGN